MSAVEQKPLFRMPVFHYTGEASVLMSVDVDMDAEVVIVGQPENGAYEWVVVNHGKVEKHSDCGYGQKSIALRDGLIAFHGLERLQEAAPVMLEALRSTLNALCEVERTVLAHETRVIIEREIAVARAAIAKATGEQS